jgi:aryl-alcohol dehydrogenase-like predicted oxidoreductase
MEPARAVASSPPPPRAQRRGSLRRLGLERIALGQLHWSAARYAPLQERALWDGLAAMHDQAGGPARQSGVCAAPCTARAAASRSGRWVGAAGRAAIFR